MSNRRPRPGTASEDIIQKNGIMTRRFLANDLPTPFSYRLGCSDTNFLDSITITLQLIMAIT